MQNSAIVTRLSQFTANPSEIIYAITMQDILTAIARRIGEDAIALTTDDLQLPGEEVKESIIIWTSGSMSTWD
jgi:hypothetical protein